ncbi:MAG TPA: hypothetical protein VK737_09540 [Opitutales bacterium]|jgi:hypothetical protein|nr:hypothetical protein [Opitutales bacterium]
MGQPPPLILPDTGEATLLTEAAMAEWWHALGRKTINFRGRIWEEVRPGGYFQPIHPLARLHKEEISRPRWWAWGYRAALADDSLAIANATLPTQLLANISDYDLSLLPPRRRTYLRGCYKDAQIVRLDRKILEDQGYEVTCSSIQRTGYLSVPTREDFMRTLRADFVRPEVVVLGGLVNGRLGGYIVGYAIEHTAYIERVLVASEFLDYNITTGVVYQFTQMCRRNAAIREMVYGLNSREDEKLCQFKDNMRFPVVQVPSRIYLNSLMSQYVRWRQPHVHYRMTGLP